MKKVLLLTMALVIVSCSKQDDNTTEILNISQEKVLSDDEIFELFDFDAKGTTVSTSRSTAGHDNWIEYLWLDNGERLLISDEEGDVSSLTDTSDGITGTVSITSRTIIAWDGSKISYNGAPGRAVSASSVETYDRIFNDYIHRLPRKYVKNRSPEYILSLINNRSTRGGFEYVSSFDNDGGRQIGYRSATCHGSTLQLQVNLEGYVSLIYWQDLLRREIEPYNNGFNIDLVVANLEFTCATEAEAVILPILREIDPGFFLSTPPVGHLLNEYNNRNGFAFFETSTCEDLNVIIHDYSGANAWQASVSSSNSGGNYNSGDIANILTQFSCYTND